MTAYRWNTDAAARAYDLAAEYIHPHYIEIQDQILNRLAELSGERFFVVDVGGGSGRLLERILERFGRAEGLIVDQSEPYLALAEERLRRYGSRAKLVLRRLQEPWAHELPRPADAIVSMSAIHHLDQGEKQNLYKRCHGCLAPKGLMLNGDEVRPESDERYLSELQSWSAHISRQLEAGHIPETFAEMFDKWRFRNIEQFTAPRRSGDDCHETIDAQLQYLLGADFAQANTVWRRGMWAVMAGEK